MAGVEHRIHLACGEERLGKREEGAGQEGAGPIGRDVKMALGEEAVGMNRSQSVVHCDFEGVVEGRRAFREELVVDRRQEIRVGH